MTDWSTVSIRVDGHVAQLSLSRSSKSNALDHQAFDELPKALDWIEAQEDVRVVVLTGEGRNFCGGIDLSVARSILQRVTDSSQCPSRAREQLRRDILAMQDAFTAFERCRAPVVAAVQGHCVGAGVDLVTACDIRCCTESASFCVKEIDLGITADLGTLQRLFRLVGEGRARELALTARTFSGGEARAMGLVTHCYPDEAAMWEGVHLLAAKIAAKSPVAAYGTKRACLHAREHTVSDGLEQVALWNSAQLVSNDLSEAFEALQQRRQPQFSKL